MSKSSNVATGYSGVLREDVRMHLAVRVDFRVAVLGATGGTIARQQFIRPMRRSSLARTVVRLNEHLETAIVLSSRGCPMERLFTVSGPF